MKSHLVLLCFTSIFCSRGAFADGKVNIYTQNHDEDTLHYELKTSVTLNCNSTDSGQFSWEKGGKPLSDVSELKGRFVVENGTLTLKELKESDAGNYTCILKNSDDRLTDSISLLVVRSSGKLKNAKWGVRVPKNANVPDGEKLTIRCDIRGNLSLTWFYRNVTSGANLTQINGNSERIKLSSYYDEDQKVNVTDGELRLEEVNLGDRGEYICIGENVAQDLKFNSTCFVRIKDKYAALWPFLGICAEVFVLCAIIFIYEKKRNKTELEESDTDQSPDQKNTPDHGKESNLRHRQ